ncbi:universal stress protein [Natronoarchaeum sp. GCM10025703]|uniref:universal stress protein n=1 Tax=unclassified Natronoarchaeum TaxID=2620183 RepID=UPI00361918A0
MGREILVPVDGSDTAWKALEHALEHHEGDSITVLYVIHPLEGDYVTENGEQIKQSEQIAREARDRFDRVDPEATEFDVQFREGRPAHVILSYTREHDIDQAVMGSKGLSGVKRLLLGSVAETVVRRSDVPVNVVR